MPQKGNWLRAISTCPFLDLGLTSEQRNSRIRRRQFPGITNFFSDKRGISGRVFQKILGTFEEELINAELAPGDQTRRGLLQQTVTALSMIAESDLILAYVAEVTVKENKMKQEFVDIELPATGSFIGNGFVLHNSARRYERLREMELSDYFNRLADHAKKAFLESQQIKGLIVGGPAPQKKNS